MKRKPNLRVKENGHKIKNPLPVVFIRFGRGFLVEGKI